MDVYDWVKLGEEKGFCSPAVCATHDGIPGVGNEEAEWEEGHDPCQHIVRLLHEGETVAS